MKWLWVFIMFVLMAGSVVKISYAAGAERMVFSKLTATDKKTGLMWTRDANIAGKGMTWFMTSTFIEKLNKQKYAGYSDWRVPTIEELKTLADYVKAQGCERGCNKLFIKIGFRKVQDSYWSSSPYRDTEDSIGHWAQGIILRDGGYVFRDSMILRTNVWPVRGGQ